jgi:hypothetical protein
MQSLKTAALFVLMGSLADRANASMILPPADAFLLAGAGGVHTGVVGSSSDGAFMKQINGGVLFSFSGGSSAGAGGSFVAGVAVASVVPVPFTATGALAIAGPGQTADADAAAAAGGNLAFASAGTFGGFDITIDPSLLTKGHAQSSMSFQLIFNGNTLFAASATLNDGFLTTSGQFSPGDLQVQTIGSETLATLTTLQFATSSITITDAEVGQLLPFEFDQTFTADAQNGGFAQAGSVPEPATITLLGTGLVSLLCYTWCRSRNRASPSTKRLF